MTHFKWCGQFKMLSEWGNKIHFSEIRSFSLRSIPSIMEQSSSLLAELDWNSFFDSAQPTATRRNWMLTLRCWLLDHPESSRGKLFQFPHRGAAQTHFNEFNLSDTAGPFSSSRESVNAGASSGGKKKNAVSISKLVHHANGWRSSRRAMMMVVPKGSWNVAICGGREWRWEKRSTAEKFIQFQRRHTQHTLCNNSFMNCSDPIAESLGESELVSLAKEW